MESVIEEAIAGGIAGGVWAAVIVLIGGVWLFVTQCWVKIADPSHKPVVLGLLAWVAMLVYPPWHVQAGRFRYRDMGYSFLWDPPKNISSINFERLGIQLLIIAVVCAIFYFIFKKKVRSDNQ